MAITRSSGLRSGSPNARGRWRTMVRRPPWATEILPRQWNILGAVANALCLLRGPTRYPIPAAETWTELARFDQVAASGLSPPRDEKQISPGNLIKSSLRGNLIRSVRSRVRSTTSTGGKTKGGTGCAIRYWQLPWWPLPPLPKTKLRPAIRLRHGNFFKTRNTPKVC